MNGTFFVDLDGTIVKHGTTKFLLNARRFLDLLEENDIRLIFVTRRGDKEFEGHPVYGKVATQSFLEDNGLGHHEIIFDVSNPRILFDDSDVQAIRRVTNGGFSEENLKMISSWAKNGATGRLDRIL